VNSDSTVSAGDATVGADIFGNNDNIVIVVVIADMCQFAAGPVNRLSRVFD